MPPVYSTTSVFGLRYLSLTNQPGKYMDDGLKALADDAEAAFVAQSVSQYVASSVATTLTAGTWTDLSGLSLSITLASAGVLMVHGSVQMSLTRAAPGATGGATSIRVVVDGTPGAQGNGVLMSSGGDLAQLVAPSVVMAHLSLASGAHTIKLQALSEALAATNVTVAAQDGSLAAWS